jgi:hypothetical protein
MVVPIPAPFIVILSTAGNVMSSSEYVPTAIEILTPATTSIKACVSVKKGLP